MPNPAPYDPHLSDDEVEDFLVGCGELQRIAVETLTTGIRREIDSLGGMASVWHDDHKVIHVRVPCVEPVSATMRILDMVRQQDADMRIRRCQAYRRGCILEFQADITHASVEKGWACGP